jgi:UDP-2,3-diacylglucosamine hydrolase
VNELKNPGKIYFASDFHLGLKTGTPPLERERKVVRWLNDISSDASEIYLAGDVFDFWWEYRLVVPRGFTRFLGCISSLTDRGIAVHFLTGNHDMWVRDYISSECGVIIHTSPVTAEFNGRRFHIAHGEGLGSDSLAYRILLKIFRNKVLRALYSSLHPSIGVGIGHWWSLSSRLGKGIRLEFMGEENEDLIKYARSLAQKEKIDYFIFGHRHLAMTFRLNNGSEICFLGDWINQGSFAEWDGNRLTLKTPD